MSQSHELQQLAARQHGLATREQLLALGFTGRQISRRSTLGEWCRIAPAVYDLMPGHPHELRPIHAAVLATDGWASHRSAAALRGLWCEPTAPRPEVIVRSGRNARNARAARVGGPILHRSSVLPAEDLDVVDGIACTSVLRTLLDLAAVADTEQLAFAVGQALASGLTTVHAIEGYLAPGLSGRPGGSALRTLLDRRADTQLGVQRRLNDVVHYAVRAGLLPPPVRDHRLTFGGRVLQLDLAWPEQMVLVEAESARPTPRTRCAGSAIAIATARCWCSSGGCPCGSVGRWPTARRRW